MDKNYVKSIVAGILLLASTTVHAQTHLPENLSQMMFKNSEFKIDSVFAPDYKEYFVYDELDRNISIIGVSEFTDDDGITYRNESKVEMEYNDKGQLATVYNYLPIKGDGLPYLTSKAVYEYDEQGRIAKLENNSVEDDGRFVTSNAFFYTYEDNGLFVETHEYYNDNGDVTDTYVQKYEERYDKDGNLVFSCIYKQEDGTWFITEKCSYEYDDHQNLTRSDEYSRYSLGVEASENTNIFRYTYDDQERLTMEEWYNAGTDAYDIQCKYSHEEKDGVVIVRKSFEGYSGEMIDDYYFSKTMAAGIKAPAAARNASEKRLQNGRIVIESNGRLYDLNGVRQ